MRFHQRLNFRFLKDYLLWRTCEKPYLKHAEFKKKEGEKIPFIIANKSKQFITKKSANELMA